MNEGENVEDALRREIKEEVGCESRLIKPVGMTIEYRNKYQLLHISYCFVTKVVGEIGKPDLEVGDIEEEQETVWLPPSVVLEKMKKDQPQKFEGHFILNEKLVF